MCLTVKKGCKPKIAKKDITCWKAVTEGVGCWYPVWYNQYSYPYNETCNAMKCRQKVLTNLYVIDQWNEIDEGLHAFRNLYGILYALISESYIPVDDMFDFKICIIPEGAEYCKGTHGQIVTTQMIVFSSFKEYLKYKSKKK